MMKKEVLRMIHRYIWFPRRSASNAYCNELHRPSARYQSSTVRNNNNNKYDTQIPYKLPLKTSQKNTLQI